nr:hypothetical protein [Tanacetum cinerariifolium]
STRMQKRGKVIVNFFMTKGQSIPRRNKYGVILPVELTNETIRNLESYKEYYAIASGAEPPTAKASTRKKQSSSDTTIPPPTTTGKRLKTLAKATAIVKHHSIRFKMNNKKRIVNLEYFREMLQIYPRIPNQQFDELPFEEEIIAFLRELGHIGEIVIITNESRIRIGKSNFQLRLDLKSKESTLQLVYDVLKLTPFYKAFLVTADIPEIYMQEF